MIDGMNSLYKVGDQVAVKNPLLECCHGLNDKMRAMAGRLVTISEVKLDYYRIKEDPDSWCWCDLCFEPVYQEPETDLSMEGLL